jgi:hypothetical protein
MVEAVRSAADVTPRRPTQRLWLASSVAVAIGLIVALLAIGPTHVVLAPWDIFIYLDTSWRLYTGQIPNVDFHSPVGPLPYVLNCFGMKLVGVEFYAFVVGVVIFVAIASSAAIFVAHRRLPALQAFLFAVFVAFLAGATRQVGRSPSIPSYAEIYNRYGWTLITVLFLQLFVPVRKDSPERTAVEGFLAGCLIGLMAYVKLTYAGIACAGLAAAGVLAPEWRQRARLLWLALGVASVGLLAWLTTRIDFTSYLKDFFEAGHAQTLSRRGGQAKESLKHTIPFVALLAVPWLLLVVLPTRRGVLRLRAALQTTLAAGVVAMCAIVLGVTNTGEGAELPLLVVAGLVLLHGDAIRSGAEHMVRPPWPYWLSAAIVCGAIAGPIFVRDVRSVWVSALWRGYRTVSAPASQRFDAAPLRDLVIPHNVDWTTEFWKSAQVPPRVNDGLALARGHVSPEQSILTLAFSNPFPYALGGRAPRGVPTCFDLELTFNAKVHPDAASLFADVDFIMSPVITDEDAYGGGRRGTQTLESIYGSYLAERYVEVGRSRYWVLRGRRALASPLDGVNGEPR